MARGAYGIGMGAAGGAATGAAFGPIGAGVGAGVGGLIGGISSLLQSQDDAEKRKKLEEERKRALQLARVDAFRNQARMFGADTSAVDYRLNRADINRQYDQAAEQLNQDPDLDIAGFLGNVTQAAGNLRQNARAEQAEKMLRDRLLEEEGKAFNSSLKGGGRMGKWLDF